MTEQLTEHGITLPKEHTGKKPTFGIIMMGGTLAMERDDKGVLVPKKTLAELLSGIKLPLDRVDLPVDLRSDVTNIDSTNMNPRYWDMAIRKVEEIQDKCDGILMPHGTDTMAYTASAIGLALNSRLKVPIVLTGSQVPIVDSGSDAAANLERGLAVLEKATHDGSVEPMIYFGKEAFRGLTAFKVNEAELDAFETASIPALYRFNAMGVSRNAQPRTLENSRRNREELREVLPFSLESRFSSDVVGMELKPGLTVGAVEWMAKYPGCRVLLLKSFGAGNVPNSKDPEDVLYNLIPAIRTIIHDLGKAVIITSPFRGGDTHTQIYETGMEAVEAGAIDAGKMTDEAAHTKASLLLGQDYFSSLGFAQDPEARMDTFKKLFKYDFAGETGKDFDFMSTVPK